MTTKQNTRTRRFRTKATSAAILAGAGAAVVAATLGAAAPAQAGDTALLAIVYSPATGAYGWANGVDSPADLFNYAMMQCQNRGGTDCHLIDDAYDCATLVAQVGHADRYSVGIGPNRIQADAHALLKVPASYILMSHCSTGTDGIG
jgi:hypothetical protein